VGPVGQTGPLAKTVALRLLDHLLGAVGAQPEISTAGRPQLSAADDVPF
jgi:hypothetical protein